MRTLSGVIRPTLHSRHDMFTVKEMFCRGIIRPARPGSVVDIGSNIGLSALFFLTRTSGCHGSLYEPVPRNVERLRANLGGYAER